MRNPDTLAHEARSRASLYTLLGRIFLSELTADELHRMRDMLEEVSEMHELYAILMGDLTELENELRVAYTHIFILNVYPHESVFYDGLLNTERTYQVLAAYRVQGYEPDLERTRARTYDHIGLELLFMALLAEKEADAWKAGEVEKARQLLSAELSFARQHLVAWAPLFTIAVREVSEHPFYTIASDLLERFIFEDHEYLSELCGWLDRGVHDSLSTG
jgi:TorA maturation chaperone TorD